MPLAARRGLQGRPLRRPRPERHARRRPHRRYAGEEAQALPPADDRGAGGGWPRLPAGGGANGRGGPGPPRPGREPRPDASQEEQARQLLAALRSQPFSPPALDGDDDLLSYLEDRGDIVWVAEGIVCAAEAYREMVERVVAPLGERRTVTLAQVRDLLGTSRKYAQALLEPMDEQRVTRRAGDGRVLGSGLSRSAG